MRGKMCVRTLGMMVLMGVLLGSLVACESWGTEPEQSYLVSAMGFDCSEDGILVTIEIPVIGADRSETAKTILCSESGRSVKEALARIQRALPRTLVFSHCALAVLGEDLSREQMQEIFEFAETGESLPLATEVVRAANAEKILRAGSLSAPAVGYEIPHMLERERGRMGVEMRCSIYALYSTGSPNLPVAIPRVEGIRVGESATVALAGLDILRARADVIRLSAEDWIPYSILTDQFKGSSDAEQRISCVKRVLKAETDGDGVLLSLHLKLHRMGKTKAQAEELREEIASRTEALFLYARDVIGEDLFLLAEQLAGNNGGGWQDSSWMRGATLEVHCEIVEEG